MRFGVLRFPGSCDEVDALQACGRVADARIVWHGDTDLDGIDAVVVPGGFSYGDYLRVGSIARFAPAMEKVMEFAADGGPVLGICNGFQVLCEAGLLPGALLPNEGLRFLCRQVDVEVADADTVWTDACRGGDVLSIPVKHTTGRWFAPPELLDEEYPKWAEPKHLEKVEGATHFFDRKLAELGATLERAVREQGWV